MVAQILLTVFSRWNPASANIEGQFFANQFFFDEVSSCWKITTFQNYFFCTGFGRIIFRKDFLWPNKTRSPPPTLSGQISWWLWHGLEMWEIYFQNPALPDSCNDWLFQVGVLIFLSAPPFTSTKKSKPLVLPQRAIGTCLKFWSVWA